MSNMVWIQCNVGIKLPDNIPPEPDSDEVDKKWQLYDDWYEKYIEPSLDQFYNNPLFEDIDVHDQEIFIGD